MRLAESRRPGREVRDRAEEPTLARKVAFLSDRHAYPERPRAVQAIETHMSWVFLTDAHAYKLKKPMRVDGNDLRGLQARQRNCRLEIELNARFSDDVYLGLARLARAGPGMLALDGEGRPVDWLVKMRRLPRALMLDELIRAGRLDPAGLERCIDLLARFYAMCTPERLSGAELRARIAARVAGNVRELCRFPALVPRGLVKALGGRQIAFLEAEAALFDRRADEGRIVEGHGDLRPEHICLEPRPRIIDCLEFSRELRIVDPAEELGFLALECERLGAPQLRQAIFATYGAVTGDRPGTRLVDFHQSVQACVRANLALRHLDDAEPREPARWPAQARDYLRLAAEHLGGCDPPKP
jgi:uncharacterized protein